MEDDLQNSVIRKKIKIKWRWKALISFTKINEEKIGQKI